MTINLSKHAGGGNQKYLPGMMTFDGSTAYYRNSSVTVTGNKVTAAVNFNRASFTGGGAECLLWVLINSHSRVGLIIYASDFATAGRQDKCLAVVANSAGTQICRIISTDIVCDGNDHLLFFAFDGDAGTAVMTVDGVDAIDTGNAEYTAPTTGTLDTGVADVYVGSQSTVPAIPFGGKMGYVGYADAYLPNFVDFYDPSTGLQDLDETSWTEWGAQPLLWNEHGLMTDNKGSAGNMTENGTIVPAFLDDPVTFPHLGLPTVGTATSSDILTGKTAWVDGVEIVGTYPDIVTDGAVLLLDAQDPASYPGSGSTWTDLSGQGNDATLFNSPTYSDSALVFDGVNQHATFGKTGIPIGGADRTMCVFTKPITIPGAYTGILSYGTGSANLGSIMIHHSSTGIFAGWASDEVVTNVYAAGTWSYHVGIYSSANSSYYVNGALRGGPTARSWNTADNLAYIARHLDSTTYYNGAINHLTIYNRALTKEEIMQNFLALRTRYDI